MPRVPPFLERLGLGPEADVREVRRAYARELRRIDQEADPRGFQALREAYEAALQWAERPRDLDELDESDGGESAAEPEAAETFEGPEAGGRDPEGTEAPGEDAPPRFTWREAARAARFRAGEPEEDPAQPPSEPDPAPAPGWPRGRVPPDPPPLGSPAPPELLARVVFAELCAGAGRWRHEDDARDALERCFADPRLAGLEQRIELEALVAARLSEGWRPGNEHLFAAALERFEWRHDRRRLAQLGAAGAAVDPIVEEAVVLRGLEEHERYQRVARWLRSGARPPDDTLETLAPAYELLRARFPAWLRAMAPAEGIERWAAALAQLPKPAPRPAAAPARSPGNRWGAAFAVIAVVGALRICGAALSSDARSGPEKLRLSPERPGLPGGLGSPEHIEKLLAAVRAFQECEQGKVQACVVAGFAHLHGERGVPANPAFAAELFRKACTLGSGEGCLEFGRLLQAGEGVPRDEAAALAHYARACDQELPAGCAAVAALRPAAQEEAERPARRKEPARPVRGAQGERPARPEVDHADEWMKLDHGGRSGGLVRMACDGGDAAACEALGDRGPKKDAAPPE
ncbi:MAG TPA: hypothetical protein VEB43_11020 [Anaeromyxobacter sp.]|nr:hypothetical protein [Anaeromyxobacter sp.]